MRTGGGAALGERRGSWNHLEEERERRGRRKPGEATEQVRRDEGLRVEFFLGKASPGAGQGRTPGLVENVLLGKASNLVPFPLPPSTKEKEIECLGKGTGEMSSRNCLPGMLGLA